MPDSLLDQLEQVIDTTADACTVLAHALNDISRLPYIEPKVDIEQFDKEFGMPDSEVLVDPLKATHELASLYLRGAGEFILIMGEASRTQKELLVTAAPLARSCAVYAAYAFRLSDPQITAIDRCVLAMTLYERAYSRRHRKKVNYPEDVDIWLGRHRRKKISQFTQEEKVVASLFAEEDARNRKEAKLGGRRITFLEDDNFYEYMSDLMHANALNMAMSMSAALQAPEINRIRLIFDQLIMLVTGYKAGIRMNLLRNGGENESLQIVNELIYDHVAVFREARSIIEDYYKVKVHW